MGRFEWSEGQPFSIDVAVVLNELLDAIPAFEARVAVGVTAFIRFANLALDEYLLRAREGGAAVEQVEPIDPADLRQGWRVPD